MKGMIDGMAFMLVGGKMVYPEMTRQLKIKDKERFVITKGLIWSELIYQGIKPTKWHEPTNEGMNVDFKVIETEEELNKELKKLGKYTKKMKKRYGCIKGEECIEINKTRI